MPRKKVRKFLVKAHPRRARFGGIWAPNSCYITIEGREMELADADFDLYSANPNLIVEEVVPKSTKKSAPKGDNAE